MENQKGNIMQLTPTIIMEFLNGFIVQKKSFSNVKIAWAAIKFFAENTKQTVFSERMLQLFLRASKNAANKPVQKGKIWNAQQLLDDLILRPVAIWEAGAEALVLLLLASALRVDCASKIGWQFEELESLKGTWYFAFLEARKALLKGQATPGFYLEEFEQERICPIQAVRHYCALVNSVTICSTNYLFNETITGQRASKATLRRWVIFILE